MAAVVAAAGWLKNQGKRNTRETSPPVVATEPVEPANDAVQ